MGSGVKLGTSATMSDTLDPMYDELFQFNLCHKFGAGVNDILLVEIKDKNPAGSAIVGAVKIPMLTLLQAQGLTLDPAEGFQLEHPKKGKRGHLFARVHFSQYNPSNPANTLPSVPGAYFDALDGNNVRFYQGAHNDNETVPPYYKPSGQPFAVHGCWDDIYDAISNAQKFVYLTGWSVHPLTRLVRHTEGKKPIGELLKDAAERGVAVGPSSPKFGFHLCCRLLMLRFAAFCHVLMLYALSCLLTPGRLQVQYASYLGPLFRMRHPKSRWTSRLLLLTAARSLGCRMQAHACTLGCTLTPCTHL
jgi:hypothetical protein